ncbi:sensor histidine kinase [Agrobacterium larrymoorei]|uniref:histidine kinase n=1 Tax=Agrobacterium larrymoorei TaxID=160699 RepID=A0AAF0KF04_9HYPH|nr:PAS domain-containing sensor histidine kinase [Agrobacterium larrymoorei]WHA42521.1 ATP-binding protein [Agrobacterium larrymoorei]
MTEKAIALIDHAAGMWLSRMEDDADGRLETVGAIRRLVAFGVAALVVVPAVFCLVFSAAVALPLGVTVVVALFLTATALLLTLHKPAREVAEQPVARQDLLATQVPGLLLFFNEHGVVQTVSGRDQRQFPAHIQNCTGHIFAELVHVSDRIGLMQAFDTLRQGEDNAIAELRFENGTANRQVQFVYARLDMTAERDRAGRLLRVVGQLRDVTDKEVLRREVVRKAAEAESANDAKSRFLAAVSHELRTPLNAVLGFSDILAGEYFGKLENERQREYVMLIRQSGAHLLSVVNTMLDMSKLEAGHYELMMEPFRISDVISACEGMLGLQAKQKGLTLTSRIQRDLGEVVADQRAIQQVLINLAGNAIKFTESGGVVSIDAALQGNLLKLTVSDTGIGIAEDKIALLGQPFMQVQNEYTRRYEGTGLGLSLVKGLVELHGGSFAITSRPGEGTVVTVLLPADGSGQERNSCGEAEAPVEFPPRLKHNANGAEMMKRKDTADGRAKAKIA